MSPAALGATLALLVVGEARAGGPVLARLLPTAGLAPRDLAVSPDGGTLYVAVASQGENLGRLLFLSAVDGAEVLPDLAVGGEPGAVALEPGGAWGYVANTGPGDRVTKFRSATGARVGDVKTGESPVAVAFGRAGTEAYVIRGWSGVVTILDATWNQATGAFDARGNGFSRLAAGPDGRWLWATGRAGKLYRLDPRNKLVAAAMSVTALDVAVSPDGREVYAACADATVRVFTAATDELSRTIPLPAVPRGLAVAPGGGFLYVSFPREGRVASIDLARGGVAGTAKAGQAPGRIAVSPDGRFVFACDEGGKAVAVVETNGHVGPPGAAALMRLEAGGAPPEAPAPAALTLAVMDLEAQGVAASSAAVASEWLRDALVKTGAFTILERRNVDKVLGEQALQQTGCTDEACAVRLGKLLNVRRVALGSIGRFEGSYVVTVRIVDIESGTVTASETARAEAIATVESGIRDLATRLGTGGR